MGRLRVAALLLGPLAALFLDCEGSSSHSMRYFYTGVSQPGQGLPQFIIVGYVDDQLFVQYDSNIKKTQHKVPWIKKVEDDISQYWDTETQKFSSAEEIFRVNLETARNYYNLSKGLHSVQLMYGCELRPDGSKGGYFQYAYDGRDYISFDKETLTWTAADSKAEITKRKLDPDVAWNQYMKDYYEKDCIEWLQRYLEYGKETLLRTERPVGKVTHNVDVDDTETLVCQAYGFYPKEIEVTWRKDGEVLHEDTFHKNTAPHPDGTYHAWLSIKIDPKERDQYRCHVEHASLEGPLVLASGEPSDVPAPNLGLIVGCVVAAVLLIIAVMAASCIYFWKHQEGYKAASMSDRGSNTSSKGSNPTV